jgi:signal recognition particle subunit SEC65
MTTRTSRTATAALVLALGLGLASCSDDGGDSPSPQAEATQGSASSGGTYASTEEIFTALNEAGLPCEEPREGDFPGAAEAKTCILDGSEDVVLLRFDSEAEKRGYVAGIPELASAVVGENWAVETVLPETAERIAEELGGEVVAATG